MTARLHIEPDRQALVLAAAEYLAGALTASVRLRGKCDVALPGGSTPGPVFERLARHDVPWEAVQIFTGDERAVPPDDDRSNAAMIRARLLEQIEGPKPLFHRMEAESPDLEAAADQYAALLPDAFDLCVLGLGGDGHTASLFPGSAAVDEIERRVVPVLDGPHEPRLTITQRVLREARMLVVLASGEDKAPAVYRSLEGPLDAYRCPAGLAREGVWLLDAAAARDIAEAL